MYRPKCLSPFCLCLDVCSFFFEFDVYYFEGLQTENSTWLHLVIAHPCLYNMIITLYLLYLSSGMILSPISHLPLSSISVMFAVHLHSCHHDILLARKNPFLNWLFVALNNQLPTHGNQYLSIQQHYKNSLSFFTHLPSPFRLLWERLHRRLPPESMWERGSVPQEAQLLLRIHLRLRRQPLWPVLPAQVHTPHSTLKVKPLNSFVLASPSKSSRCPAKPGSCLWACRRVIVAAVRPRGSTAPALHVIQWGWGLNPESDVQPEPVCNWRPRNNLCLSCEIHPPSSWSLLLSVIKTLVGLCVCVRTHSSSRNQHAQ